MSPLKSKNPSVIRNFAVGVTVGARKSAEDAIQNLCDVISGASIIAVDMK